jgi:hypothetical protein
MSPRFDVAFWAKALTTGAILTVLLMRVDFSAIQSTLSNVERHSSSQPWGSRFP